MEKGKLSVHTENILPIIKKWLYSEKEIFLRELASNAVDALSKLRRLSLSEEIRDADDADYFVDIQIDRENGKLSFEDNGVGLTAEEIKKYITQIAFSGAEEFIKKYEESGDRSKAGIIGNFGLGFYSSFMVADKVEIDSLSWQKDAAPAHWISDGGEEYDLGPGTRTKRGTKITLHISEDSKELLDKVTIQGLVRRFCDFLPYPIKIDGVQANKQNPLWARQPSELKREDYLEFYRYLYPFQQDPLFYVHLNVDYPFKLQGVLFFPHLAHEMDLNKSEVRIYCRQVFVTDEAQELIPKYLTILQGVIDIPDLPLNVSRSYLQNEPQIKKISQHIIKKVADRLNDEFAKEPENYRKIWPDLAPFVKYAMMSDEKFYDQAKGALIFELAGAGEEKQFVTLDDYFANHKDKIGDKAFYTNDPRAQAAPLKLLREQGVEALLMNTMIDSHFMQFLESKENGRRFVRVDAELADHIVDKDGGVKLADADGRDLESNLRELFQKAIGDEKATIRVEALKSEEIPALALFPEQMRRFSEMSAMMAREMPKLPVEHTLLLNSKNAIIRALARPALVTADGGVSKQELMAKQIYYLARLAQGGVGAEELQKLLDTSYAVLERAL